MTIDTEMDGTLRYQRWLADSLVTSLGHEKAVAACVRMGWHATLNSLSSERGKAPLDSGSVRAA